MNSTASTTPREDPNKAKWIQSCRNWSPKGLADYYNWIQRASGSNFELPSHLLPTAYGLCDLRIDKLMETVGPGSGKSVLLSQIYPTYVLGHDPKQNIICVSGAENLAQGFQNVAMAIVDQNAAFKSIFPGVKPDKDRGWSTTSGMFVTGHRASSPDASYWAAGISSKALTGKHATLLIFDDLHDEENSKTTDQCSDVVRKYVMQLSGRADPMGARQLIAGRRWNVNDLYGTLKNNGDWVTLTLPAERPGSRTLWVDVVVPEGFACVYTDGKCLTPSGELVTVVEGDLSSFIVEREIRESGVVLLHIRWPYGIDQESQGFFWPESKQKRNEYFNNKRLMPAETEAVYQCNPGAKQGSVFTDDDFRRRFSLPGDAHLGAQSEAIRESISKGSMIVQAWDTAFSANSTSDHSACVTLMLTPCESYHRSENPALFGACDAHFDVYVLDVWRERVTFAGVVQKIREQNQRWSPSLVLVENKAYGVAAIEALANSGIPIEGVMPSTLESKRARAVEGVGAGSVQGWARQWRIVLPQEAPWLEAFIKEMKDFTGDKGATDDQVDALVHGIRWAIQNGGSSAGLPSEWSTVAGVDAQMLTDTGPAQSPYDNVMGSIFGADSFNPFGNCCEYCKHYNKNKRIVDTSNGQSFVSEYCSLHNRRVSSLFSCDDFLDVDEGPVNPFFANSGVI